MDIISRKAILRQLLAEYRTRKEKAEADADRVRLRIAQEVPVYGDLNGVMSRILVEASSRALAEPANAKAIAEQAQQKVRELRAQAEGALKAAGHSKEELEPMDIQKAESMEELFRKADVLSLHCPLTPETHHIINASSLSQMKSSAILINTGRGPLINENDLAEALNEGRIYAAGLDVLEQEPPRNGSPLIGARNCHITPHIAWASQEARQGLLQQVLAILQGFSNGQAINQVSL